MEFKFKIKWRGLEEWRDHGIERGYDQKNPSSISGSENREERSWYYKGRREKWLNKFKFNREILISPYKTFEEWRDHGIERGYDQKNPISLIRSENKEERSWYGKGVTKGWCNKFNFQRLSNGFLHTKKQFLTSIKEDKTLQSLVLAHQNLEGFAGDIEQIMGDISEERFGDRKKLHELLEEVKPEIDVLVKEGVTNLGFYIGHYNKGDRKIAPVLLGNIIVNLPEEKITESLENRLVRMLRTIYSPKFNDNPNFTLSEIENKVSQLDGKRKEIYQRLYQHYQDILKIKEELKN